MTDSSIAAAILAGGRARRFGGRDKSRLVVGGRPIIVRQVEVLQRIAGRTFIVGNDAARYADMDLDVHPDSVADAGALGGIYTALVSAAPAERVIVVACDMPFLDAALIRRLATLSADTDMDGAWVRTARGPEPLLACYRASAAETIRRELDAGRMRAGDLDQVLHLAVVSEEELARYGATDKLLLNVNSPEEYEKAAYFEAAT